MWYIIILVFLNGEIVTWKTPADYYTDSECVTVAVAEHEELESAIIKNKLNKDNSPYIVESWCLQTSPKEIKH